MAEKEEDGFMGSFDFGEIQNVTDEEVISLTPKVDENQPLVLRI